MEVKKSKSEETWEVKLILVKQHQGKRADDPQALSQGHSTICSTESNLIHTHTYKYLKAFARTFDLCKDILRTHKQMEE